MNLFTKKAPKPILQLLSFKVFVCACFVVFLNACSSSNNSSHRRPTPSAEFGKESNSGIQYEQPSTTNSDLNEPQSGQISIPWLTWNQGLTLKQIAFKDTRVVSGDNLFSKSDFKGALAAYHSARPVGSDESESLALRAASAELLSSDPPRSVLSLSRFFQSRKQEESQISDASALFFGFAYGQTRNYEQSLAWFSQAIRSNQNYIREQASSGVKSLLRIIPANTLEEMSFIWKSNQTISTLISEERAIRQNRPVVTLQNSDFFWTLTSGSLNSSGPLDSKNLTSNQSARKVAALLPLTGRFAKMGESIKRGLELAAELSISRGVPLDIRFQDLPSNSGSESSEYISTSALVDELAQQGISVIIGPLVSEQTAEVAESSRKNSIPAILLSKGGNATLGDGIYRFGLTNQSQANSLVSAIMRFRSNPRISLIYPDDEAGRDFIAAIQDSLKQFNVAAIDQFAYTKGNSAQMLAHTSDLEMNPPEFVIFGDNLKAAIQFFGALSPNARKAIVPVGSALWDNPLEIMQSKTILAGAIYVSPFYPDMSKPLVSEFVNRFKEKNAKTPDFFAAQGYDVGLIVSASGNSLETMYTPPPNLDGITGLAHSYNDGEILRDLAVLRLSHGTIAPISEITPPNPLSLSAQEGPAENSDKGSLVIPPMEDGDQTVSR